MITCSLITEKVCDHYGIGRNLLIGRYGSTSTAEAREAAWLLCRRLAGRSYPEIARLMGGYDHSAIIVGVRRAEKKEAAGGDFTRAITAIGKAVLSAHELAAEEEGKMLSDAKVLEIAEGVISGLGGRITDVQVQALAVGARRFSADAAAARNAAKEAARKAVNTAPVPAPLRPASEIIRQCAIDVAAAYSGVEQAQFTSGENAARMKLERVLKTLKTTMEKLK